MTEHILAHIEIYFRAIVYCAFAVLVIALFLRGTGKDFEEWMRRQDELDRIRAAEIASQCPLIVLESRRAGDGRADNWLGDRAAEASTEVGHK
jgi:hypothetical protein